MKRRKTGHTFEQTTLLTDLKHAPKGFFDKFSVAERQWFVQWQLVAYHTVSWIMDLITMVSTFHDNEFDQLSDVLAPESLKDGARSFLFFCSSFSLFLS